MKVEDIISDVFVDVGKTPEELLKATIFDSMPDSINGVAKEQGWCDIKVHEKVYAVAWKMSIVSQQMHRLQGIAND